MSDKEKQYAKEDLNAILDQQIIISQLSQGISFSDTDKMDNYERSYLLAKLIQLEKEKLDAKRKAIEEARNK